MTMTRRQILLGALLTLSASLAMALPKESAPLDVTYYFLPG
jgi:hypothetical protein